jgi:hypothetical protein
MRSLAIVKDLGEAAESVSSAVCRVAVDVREGVWSLLRHSGEAAECLIFCVSGAVSLFCSSYHSCIEKKDIP